MRECFHKVDTEFPYGDTQEATSDQADGDNDDCNGNDDTCRPLCCEDSLYDQPCHKPQKCPWQELSQSCMHEWVVSWKKVDLSLHPRP